MTVRITQNEERDGDRTIVRIEGTLTRNDVGLLDQFCEDLAVGPSGVIIDLAGVHFVDVDAAKTLRQLMRRGAQLEGSNPFVRQLVDLAE